MILLTGATGFLGRYVLNELQAKNLPVRALVRDPKTVAQSGIRGVEWAEGDILDVLSLERAMEGCSHVIHSAAVVSFWKRRYAEMDRVNIRGTENVVNCALDAGISKLVHVSSIAAIGRSRLHPVVDEKLVWTESRDNSHYALTKHLAEMEVLRGVEEGLKAVMVNPGVILGAALNGRWENGSAQFVKNIAGGMRFYPAGGSGFVSARDVAKAILCLLESDKQSGERYILVSDNLPYKEVFGMIAKAIGVKAPALQVPGFPARLAGLLSEGLAGITGKEPLITRETTATSARTWKFTGTKIENETSFRYSDLAAFLEEVGKQWRAK